MARPVTARRDAGWAVAIFVTVFAVYMATSSREPAWGDAHPMWEVAASLVSSHDLSIPVRWPEDIPPGRGGKYYGIAPIGPSLVLLPGAVFAAWSHSLEPTLDVVLRPWFTHLGPAALGAIACVVFFGLLRDLGVRAKTASLCTALLAFSTTTFVYARMPYSEILQLAAFLGLVRQVLRVAALAELPPDSRTQVRRLGLWLGAWAGILLNAKYIFASAILGGGVVILWAFRRELRERATQRWLVRLLGWAALTGVPCVALALLYNYLRWGSVFATGYEPYLHAFFGGSLFDGAWGMLLSPNKSAFLYSPPLVLALLAGPATVRAIPRYGVAVLAMVVPVFLVYCTYRSWSGDYAWGPRFFVWAVPVLLVPLAWFVDASMDRWRRWVVLAIAGAGLAIQLLGASLYWDHFIRISILAKNQWLGQPDRRGSYIAERGRGHCDSCFEDTYQVLWTPAFSPIRGQLWLLKALARGDDQLAAQADAPWRYYTTLPLKLGDSYDRVRIDWWGLTWIRDNPAAFRFGLVLLFGMGAGAYVGGSRWRRLHRAAL